MLLELYTEGGPPAQQPLLPLAQQRATTLTTATVTATVTTHDAAADDPGAVHG